MLSKLTGHVKHYLFANDRGVVSVDYIVMAAGAAVLATSVVSSIGFGLRNKAEAIADTISSTGTQTSNTGSVGLGVTLGPAASSNASDSKAAKAKAAQAAIAKLVHAMGQEQFPDIPPDQIKYLQASQLAAVSSAWWFGQIPAASMGMLSAAQIQAISPSVLAPNAGKLTAPQIDAMTSAQFSVVKGGDAIVNMLKKQPSIVSSITPGQVASIKNSWWLGQLINTSGSSLSSPQIQAALPSAMSPNAGKLTAQQIGWLNPAQVSAVKGSDALVNMLTKSPGTLSQITPAQIGTIQHPWWFGQIPIPVLQAMSEAQVNAIPADIYPNIKGELTAIQQAWHS